MKKQLKDNYPIIFGGNPTLAHLVEHLTVVVFHLLKG